VRKEEKEMLRRKKRQARALLARLIARPPRLIYRRTRCKRLRTSRQREIHQRTSRTARNLRIRTRLRILTATPHNDIRRTRLRPQIPLVRILPLCRLLEESHRRARDPAVVARHQSGGDAEEAFAGFFGEVGLFEDALRAVDVGQVEGGAGVAGVEDAGEADAGGEGLDEDAVHFVVDNVPDLAEVEGVDYWLNEVSSSLEVGSRCSHTLIVTVVFVSVEVGRLTTMAGVVEE